MLQTENAAIGIVAESTLIRQLSLNGGNVLNLITLAPSVVPQGGSEEELTGKNVFAAGNYRIGGGTANQSASYFDGVTVQDSAYGNIVVLTRVRRRSKSSACRPTTAAPSSAASPAAL